MKNTQEQITKLYETKATHYNAKLNPFSQFIKATKARNLTKEQALDFMRLKHEISIQEMLESDEAFDADVVNEKFNDYITYSIILLEMLEAEEYDPNPLFMEAFWERFVMKDYTEQEALEAFDTYIIFTKTQPYRRLRRFHYFELVSALIVLKNMVLERATILEPV